MRTKIARQARRHKIGKGHITAVMASDPVEATRPNGETELSWIAPDDRGIELEIIAVLTTDDRTGAPILLVIHAMPTALRERN
jgi:hypothetical protein